MDPLIKSQGQRGPEPNIDKKAKLFQPRLLFLRQWKVYIPPTFRHKKSTAENARLKGSALALRAAVADINIHKSRSVYYVSQKDSGRAVAEKMQTWHIRIYE